MANLKLISADSHVNEPADLWLERIDKTFRDRAPRVVSAENEVSWLPFVLQRWDQAFAEYRHMYPTPLKLAPSEYFHRQVHATFIDDPLAARHRHDVGIANMMWSSDYPHTVSTWPHSQETIARDFADVPDDERRRIVRDNAIRLYSLDVAG